jgi:Glycosyltransferase family 10 (fucosyltransferase) C-term/Alpha-(1,3)-fucosyltransferase FucT N-terminal domain
MKTIRIATLGTPHDYQTSLIPIMINSLGYKVDWVTPTKADLIILGPFLEPQKKKYGWCPKPLRPLASSVDHSLQELLMTRKYQPVKLFHTQENVRYDQVKADYSISFDLGVQSEKHLRFPYWMEMLDWSHEGITGNTNPRYGELIKISTLMSPLGNQFIARGNSCAMLSSHLREPRGSLYRAIEAIVPIQGFGAHFDKSIKDHHSSGFLKKDILKKFSFNLCPENGLYPGYYTEKIPEAFNSGCLPITWADENIDADFNPQAFLNLLPSFKNNFRNLKDILHSKVEMENYQSQPLLIQKPTIESLNIFLRNILKSML